MSVFDYCKHGIYIDRYVSEPCLWCEMGWPDPSPKEIRLHADLAYRHLKDHLRLCLKLADQFSARRSWRWYRWRQSFMEASLREYHGHVEALAEAKRWANGPDDTDWMERRHRQWCLDEIEAERRAGA